MANFSIGTAGQYDALNLLPAVETTAGFWRGSTIDCVAVVSGDIFTSICKLRTATAPQYRTVIANSSGLTNYAIDIVANTQTVASIGWGSVTPTSSTTNMDTYTGTATTATGIGRLTIGRGNSIIQGMYKLERNGIVVDEILTKPSDYKQNLIGGWILISSIAWYKLANDGKEINNYLTGTLLHNALAGTTQTEPIVVYVLDPSTDVSMIQSSYNGQPVTISYEYAPKGRKKLFWRGFGFRA